MQIDFIAGKKVLITGATAGIGKEAAIRLAEMGAQVMILARNMQKGITSQREIQMKSGKGRVELYHADLSSLKSVKEFTEQFKKRHSSIDVLINNAGMMTTGQKNSEDGFELTFAVNQLAPYYLTRELIPLLQASDTGRIVNVASDAHYKAKIDEIEALTDPPEFKGFQVYCNSKLCNVATSVEMQRRYPDLVINALHPGVVATDIVRSYPAPVKLAWSLVTMSPRKSAKFVIRLAATPDLSGGNYYSKAKKKEPSAQARDPQFAQDLLDHCENWIQSATNAEAADVASGSGDAEISDAGSGQKPVKKKASRKKSASAGRSGRK